MQRNRDQYAGKNNGAQYRNRWTAITGSERVVNIVQPALRADFQLAQKLARIAFAAVDGRKTGDAKTQPPLGIVALEPDLDDKGFRWRQDFSPRL